MVSCVRFGLFSSKVLFFNLPSKSCWNIKIFVELSSKIIYFWVRRTKKSRQSTHPTAVPQTFCDGDDDLVVSRGILVEQKWCQSAEGFQCTFFHMKEANYYWHEQWRALCTLQMQIYHDGDSSATKYASRCWIWARTFFSPKNEEIQKQRCSLLKIHPVKSGIPLGFIPELCKKKQIRSEKSWEILLGNVFLDIPRSCFNLPEIFNPYIVESEDLVFHVYDSLTSGCSHWFQWNCPLALEC